MSEITISQYDLINKTVDPELGIIEDLALIGLQPSELDIHIAVAVSQDPSAISPLTKNFPSIKKNDRQAAGAGLSFAAAIWSTIGESLERYSASIISPEEIKISTISDLQGEAISPYDFVRFSKKQHMSPDFPFLRYSPEKKIAWTKGARIVKNEEVWIPSDFVYMAHAGGNSRLDKGYSTGLGAHKVKQKAASVAIREVVERDAYMSRYLIGAKPPEIPSELLRDLLEEVWDSLEQRSISIRVFDLTNEFSLPTALCHILLPNDMGIASGASCQVSAKGCVEKAVIECLHTYNWLIDMDRWNVKAELSDIAHFMDHVSYHRNSEAKARYEQFLDAEQGAPMMDVEQFYGNDLEELEYIVNKIEKAGHEVYIADVTSLDVERLGFFVFRSVIPSLQPISSGIDFPHLDERRLRKVAELNGIEWHDNIINMHPHPFP